MGNQLISILKKCLFLYEKEAIFTSFLSAFLDLLTNQRVHTSFKISLTFSENI